MAVTKDEIAEIKGRVSIVDVIGRYVTLTKSGKNYMGLCPFHNEKTPSFSVNADKGLYRCFGCGQAGDIIKFLEDYKRIDFQSAMAELAELAGVRLDFETEVSQKENPNAPLLEANNQASRIYQTVLSSTEIGQRARQYLHDRGINDDQIKVFEIGLAPDEDDFLYQNLSPKFGSEVLAKSGLFNFGQSQVYDTFQNRLIFPIQNIHGQTVGFSGRIWQVDDGDSRKYLNTASTEVFDKSFEFYNLNRAKAGINKYHELYLMEGFMDVIAAYKSGVNNVIATMGTALTEKHVKRLSRLTQKVILVYDGDKAGQAAIEKALFLIKDLSIQLRVIKIPDALDPDEFARERGTEALSILLKGGGVSRSEFLMDYLQPTNLTGVDSQVDFLNQMAPIIAQDASIQAQDVYIHRLVEILPDFAYNKVEETVNAYRVNQLTDKKPRSSQAVSQEILNLPDTISPRISSSERIERQLLNRMILHPDIIEQVMQNEEIKFFHQNTQTLVEAVLVDYWTYQTIDPDQLAERLELPERNLLYQILALDLPYNLSEEELTDLMAGLAREKVEIEIANTVKALKSAHKMNDEIRERELATHIFELRKQIQGGISGRNK